MRPNDNVHDLLLGHPHFQFVSRLGQGTFGIVLLYSWNGFRNITPGQALLVAVKFLPRRDVDTKYLRAELINHRNLEHPHIVQCYKIGLTEDRRYVYMVMEYAGGGNLFEYMNRLPARQAPTPPRLPPLAGLSEDHARWFFQQLIMGVDYCHKKDVVNRDLKLDNLLLSFIRTDAPGLPLQTRGHVEPKELHIKIADFGLCKNVTQMSAPRSRVGTLYYMAPEVVSATSTGSYDGQKADIWSCGVILYILLFRKYPWRGQGGNAGAAGRRQTVEDIQHGRWEVPAEAAAVLSAPCRDLLSLMLQPDPLQRIGMSGIVSHPWFQLGLPEELKEAGFFAFNDSIVQEQRESPPLQEQTMEEVEAVLADAQSSAALPDGLPLALGAPGGAVGVPGAELGAQGADTLIIDQEVDVYLDEHPSEFTAHADDPMHDSTPM